MNLFLLAKASTQQPTHYVKHRWNKSQWYNKYRQYNPYTNKYFRS